MVASSSGDFPARLRALSGDVVGKDQLGHPERFERHRDADGDRIEGLLLALWTPHDPPAVRASADSWMMMRSLHRRLLPCCVPASGGTGYPPHRPPNRTRWLVCPLVN